VGKPLLEDKNYWIALTGRSRAAGNWQNSESQSKRNVERC